jgi:hypothetical protein
VPPSIRYAFSILFGFIYLFTLIHQRRNPVKEKSGGPEIRFDLDFRSRLQDIVAREGEGAEFGAPGGDCMIDPVKPAIASANIPTPSKASVTQAVVPAKPDLTKTDTVQLSDESQARSMRQNGMSIPDIALQLRLDIKTVTGFFPLSKS